MFSFAVFSPRALVAQLIGKGRGRRFTGGEGGEDGTVARNQGWIIFLPERIKPIERDEEGKIQLGVYLVLLLIRCSSFRLFS